MHRISKRVAENHSRKASQETRTPAGFRARRNPHSPKSNRMPDAPHSVKVVAKIVDGIEDLREHFIRSIKMTQVGARVAAANLAGTNRVKWVLVPSVPGLLD